MIKTVSCSDALFYPGLFGDPCDPRVWQDMNDGIGTGFPQLPDAFGGG